MLISLVRRKTDFVFRYGGEEFALILSPTSQETAVQLAEKTVAETHNLPFSHSQSPFEKVTVSVGLVYVESSIRIDFQELIRQADMALYEAKKSGRNRYVVKDF